MNLDLETEIQNVLRLLAQIARYAATLTPPGRSDDNGNYFCEALDTHLPYLDDIRERTPPGFVDWVIHEHEALQSHYKS